MLPRTHLSLNHHLQISAYHCSTTAPAQPAAGSPEEVHYEVPGAVPLPVPLTVPLVLSVRPRLLALPATDCFELALIVAKIIFIFITYATCISPLDLVTGDLGAVIPDLVHLAITHAPLHHLAVALQSVSSHQNINYYHIYLPRPI